jgi:YesN/AraC family two-component response regulator
MLIFEILDLLAEPSEIQVVSETASVTEDVSEKKEKIDRFISCNLLGRFSLDDISAYVGMNRTYFCLFFKKHYGISLTDHVNRMRVDMACAMLKQGNMPISEIAKASGFPTVTYFNRVFKKIMGISPRELQ